MVPADEFHVPGIHSQELNNDALGGSAPKTSLRGKAQIPLEKPESDLLKVILRNQGIPDTVKGNFAIASELLLFKRTSEPALITLSCDDAATLSNSLTGNGLSRRQNDILEVIKTKLSNASSWIKE